MTGHAEHHHALSYADAVRQHRADKDAYFSTGHGSPVPAGDRAAFTGIPYFPVDESFVADGLVLEPYPGDEPVLWARLQPDVSPTFGPDDSRRCSCRRSTLARTRQGLWPTKRASREVP